MVENKLHFILTSGSAQHTGRCGLFAKSRPDSDLASCGGPVPYQVLVPPHLFAQKAKSTLLMYASNLLPCRLADSEYDLAEISFSIGRY